MATIGDPTGQSEAGISGEYALATRSLGSTYADILRPLKIGDLFTSAMTGNAALLAIAGWQGDRWLDDSLC